MSKELKFTGSGVNAPSIKVSLARASESPSKSSFTVGATWPFVTLTLGKKRVEFRMPGVIKFATATDSKITLSKLGYLFFRSADPNNDFGFSTLALNRLIVGLKAMGFELDSTCITNLKIARLFHVIFLSFGLLFLACVFAVMFATGTRGLS
ncbi:hypothetical protein IPP75_01100 [Candidatus Saccharibacteria bacterium]|nr:MAG: hypothetical protein IPP75_01100 [Candidatus Saccharibacteria bacterium]